MHTAFRVLLVSASLAASCLGQGSTSPSGQPAARQTPASADLAQRGQDAFDQGKFTTAVYLLSEAVSQNPKHTWAWNDLCRSYLALDKLDAAAEACRKQIEVDRRNPNAYSNLGRVLWRQQKYEEAIAAFRMQIEINPRDRYAHANLGALEYFLKKYSAAVPELEMAVEIEPQNSVHKVALGAAYLANGQTSKGLSLLERVVQDSPGMQTWNNVAYHLALQGIELEKAQKYAESALEGEAPVMRNIEMDHIATATFRHVALIANCWDTLGWIKFQRGNLEEAAKYLRAAWSLNQSGAAADHLGQLYARRGQKDEAIHMFTMSLAARDPLPDTHERLASLLGNETQIDALRSDAHGELLRMRTVRVGKLSPERSVAEFYISQAIVPGSTEAKFLRGDERLRQAARDLQAPADPGIFPDSAVPKLVRRAALTCPGNGGECSLEFDPAPAAVIAELNAAAVDKEFAGTHSGGVPPSVIYKVEPQYSEKARKKKLQGTVLLYVEVDTGGHARNIRVIRSLGLGLDEEAIKAVEQWQFKPGEKDGRPVSVAATIEVNFRLLKTPRR